MAIFNSYVSHYQRVSLEFVGHVTKIGTRKHW